MPFLNDALLKGKETKWNATWIHPDFIDRNGVHYFWFYKEFEVEEMPKKAAMDISADLKYVLYINDRFIGRGPLYGTPDYYSFDSYELSDTVRTGTNTVWVLVMQDCPGDYMNKERPLALLAQVKLTGKDGNVTYIGTDTSWICFKDNGWNSVTPRVFYDLTNMEALEVYDARKSLNKNNFNPAKDDFIHAKTYSHVRGIRELFSESTINHLGMMWRYLQPRDIPYMVERNVEGSLVSYGEVEPGNVDKHAYMVVPQMFQNLEKVDPVKYTTIENIEAVTRTDDSYALLQAATQPEYPFRSCYPAFILDFGEIMNGYIRIDLDAPAGCIIDIAYAHVLDDGKIYYKTGHQYRNKRYICKEGRQQWESFEFVNARYLQVTIRFQTPPVFCIQEFLPVKFYHVGLRRTDFGVKKKAV
ncbi:MAG: family 78 glycoside hydrolase catalytic domain [Lachnospiraceae bacterium]|nr:family 78 glycoside hydrolase catalytic domain [Lachnospiraceae bacterium]